MFIVFGWGKGRNRNHGSVSIAKCHECYKEGEWSLIETRNTFNIFFIPIFAYDNRYFLVCNNCGRNSFEIFGDQVNAAKKMIGFFRSYHSGRLSIEDLKNELKHNRIIKGVESPNDIWECPECAEKNLNTSFKCKKCGYSIV